HPSLSGGHCCGRGPAGSQTILATRVQAYRRITRVVRADRNRIYRTRRTPLFRRPWRPCKLFGNSLRAAKDSFGQPRIACSQSTVVNSGDVSGIQAKVTRRSEAKNPAEQRCRKKVTSP